MQATHRAEAARAGHEHGSADGDMGFGTGLDHAADVLVAGNQRIAHAGEVGHPAGEQKPLGSRAHSAPQRIDDDVASRRSVERKGRKHQTPRLLQNDRQGPQHMQRSCDQTPHM